MKATSMRPRSGQRPASSNAVVLLHGHQLERNLARAVTAEAAGTFALVLAITSTAVAAALSRPVAGAPVAVATDSRVPRGIAAMAIGAALAVAIVIAGPVSGAGVNPAWAIGPMILAGQLSDWWAYLAAPLAGGAIAVALYDRFLRAGNTPAYRPRPQMTTSPRPLRDQTVTIPDRDWRQLAACRHTDPELFFPLSASGPSLDQVTQAKAICAGCPSAGNAWPSR